MKRKRYSIVLFAMLLFCAVRPGASMENSSPANNPEDLQSVQSPADSEVEPVVVVDESAPDERTSLQQVTDLHAEGNLEDLLSRGPGYRTLMRYSMQRQMYNN